MRPLAQAAQQERSRDRTWTWPSRLPAEPCPYPPFNTASWDGYVCARVLSIGCTLKTPGELLTNMDATKGWIAFLQIQMLKT